jgi:hypothetical protein
MNSRKMELLATIQLNIFLFSNSTSDIFKVEITISCLGLFT